MKKYEFLVDETCISQIQMQEFDNHEPGNVIKH